MAKNYELVRDALQRVGADKLAEAEGAFAEHTSWLAQAVQDARNRLAASLPSAPGGDASTDPVKAAGLDAVAGATRGKVRAFCRAYAKMPELVCAARPGMASSVTYQLLASASFTTIFTRRQI